MTISAEDAEAVVREWRRQLRRYMGFYPQEAFAWKGRESLLGVALAPVA